MGGNGRPWGNPPFDGPSPGPALPLVWLPMTGSLANSSALGTGFVFVFFLFPFIIFIGSVVMLIVALVDIVKRPEWQWKLAGQDKILWLLLVILVNILAIPALIYWFSIRTKLMAVQTAAAAGQYGPGHMTYSGWEPGPPPAPFPPGMAPAGWHPDPGGVHRLRWWDGTRWTDHTWDDDHPVA